MIATDDQGNLNNVLVVQQPTNAEVADDQQRISAKIHTVNTDSDDTSPTAGELNPPAAAATSDPSVQSVDGPAMSLSPAISAAVAKVTPMENVSHDLPTPPISEGGDDNRYKEVPSQSSEDVSQESEDQSQMSKRSGGEEPSRVTAFKWSFDG